jgi:hypothetical protein
MESVTIQDLKNQSLYCKMYRNQKEMENIRKVIMNRKYKSKGNWSEERIKAELISFGFITN